MPDKIRAVLDTNVFVAGLINPKGTPGFLVKAIRDKRFILVSSEPINEEIMEVLNRPRIRDKYGLGNALFDVAFVLWEIAELVMELPTVKFSSDPDDDKFLAAAIGGKTDYLVTGDIGDLLHLKEHKGIKILSPKEFLDILG